MAELESNLDGNDQRSMAIKQVTMTELTNQPYAGQFLIYQIFEESSTPDELLITKARKNLTDFDLIQYMNSEEILDAAEYFDMNKQL